MISNRITQTAEVDYLFHTKKAAADHLVVILDDTDETYGQAFELGLMETADDQGVAVEIMRIDRSDYISEAVKALEKAIYSKADGIVLHSYDDEMLKNKIDEAFDKNIPVIAINKDVPDSKRISFVGVNRYNIGLAAGESFIRHLGEVGKVAVIDQISYGQEKTIDEEFMLLGLQEVIKAYPELTLETVEYTEEGVLSAETVATRIFSEYPDITGIFCTDGQNTLGVVQLLVDTNRVNEVVLIGYGNDNEIIQYIEKGNIVEASIITDQYELGRKVVDGYLEYKANDFVSNYINTDIRVIDQENVESYIEGKGDTDDKEE